MLGCGWSAIQCPEFHAQHWGWGWGWGEYTKHNRKQQLNKKQIKYNSGGTWKKIPAIPELRKRRQEDHQFVSSSSFIIRPWLQMGFFVTSLQQPSVLLPACILKMEIPFQLPASLSVFSLHLPLPQPLPGVKSWSRATEGCFPLR